MDAKETVKVGDRVELIHMDDTMTRLQPGDRGTVVKIESDEDEILIWVNWDNGEQLALLGDTDKFKIVTKALH
jgi:hypothetical protein